MGLTNVIRDIRALAIAVTAASLFAGCSWIHKHVDRQNDEYKTSVQERPLEVPPDLDKPNTAGALTIPQANANAGAASVAAAPDTATGSQAAAGESVAAGDAGAAPALLGADGLHVMDSVDSVWSRVG